MITAECMWPISTRGLWMSTVEPILFSGRARLAGARGGVGMPSLAVLIPPPPSFPPPQVSLSPHPTPPDRPKDVAASLDALRRVVRALRVEAGRTEEAT